MTEQEREDRLNDALDALTDDGASPATGDAELNGLLRMASTLRGMPHPDFKERLRDEVAPGPRGWRGALARAFSRASTPGGRLAVAGTAFAAGAAAVLLIVFLVGLFGGEEERHVRVPLETTFEMTATKSDAIGVDPDTEFVLSSAQDLDLDTLAAILHVEPAVDLDIERESAGRYVIRAAQPLEPGTVYNFLLEEADPAPHVLASFAFQTKTPVAIVQALPADQSTGVPPNTGIELTFTQEGVQDIESHFRIEPAVEGRFEIHKRVVVFVPEGGLTPGTLYTVTVTSGVTVAGTDEVLEEDFVLQFETNDQARTGELPRRPVLNFTRKLAEASTLEAPALETYTSENGAVTLHIEVFRFDSMDTFLDSFEQYEQIPLWAGVTRDAFVTDTGGLDPVATFDTDLQRLTDYGKSFIQFPEPLPQGFYLVRSEFDERPIQSWLQVTDVATYFALAEGETLVWANDLASKGPLAGARVEFLGTDAAGETGADGTATIDTPEELIQSETSDFGYITTETRGHLLVTAPDGRVAVVPLSSTEGYYSGYYPRSEYGGEDYWHYLSTDRPLYLPSDTIRFWGIARPREDVESEAVTVELRGSSDVFDYYYRPVIVAETEVEVSDLGTFSGELSFEGLSPNSYQLVVKVGAREITSLYIPIQTYTKPAYRIDVVPDRLAVYAGDEVRFSIRATFLEGTPVPNLRLGYSGNKVSGGEVVTDENGEAVVTFVASQAAESYYAESAYLTVAPLRAEEAEIIGEAWISVYPSAVTASAETDLVDGEGVVTGTVHHVDLSRMNEGSSKGFGDVLGDPAGGQTISLDVKEVSWKETATGEYYDFIAKIVRTRYRYDEIETPLGTFTAETDANGEFRATFPAEEDKYYRITMDVTDDQGRTESQQLYLSGAQSKFNYSSSYVYLRRPGSDSNVFGGSETFALGDEVELSMYRGAELLPSGEGNRYLFLKAQLGVKDYSVQTDSTLRFDFSDTEVPSTTVMGVWFNGRTYLQVNYGYQLRFNPDERELDIEIAPDKERYAPGDEATLDLTVTDQEGNAQPGTEVNVAVVDEALFLIQGPQTYNQDVLDSVYAPVGSGILRTYASHQYPNDIQAAERGGDGGPRRDFADLVFFGEVTTDGDGHGSVTFTLPDNLTSWRVTAQGFNDDLLAGTAVRLLPVGLPFFVDVTMNDEYLMTDKPEIKLRSFGVDLESGSEVTFRVSAPSLGLEDPVEVTAPAFGAPRVALPELHEGTHEILIEGQSGELEDSLIRTVRVVPSRLVSAQTRFYELSDGLRVEGSGDAQTRVVISDHERGRYFGTLQQLTWGNGDRVDQMLARDVAAELLETFYEDVEARGEEFDASIYQTPNGGIALLPYSGEDLALSARAAAVSPERFGATGLNTYFLRVLQNQKETRERQVIALYGLAALHEPALVPLQTLLREPNLTWRERLYAGLALVEAGDDTNARAVFQALSDEFGESRAPAYRLRVGEDQDDILEATSLAAILAAGVGDALAPQLFAYTEDNYTTDILVELERISYLAKALPRLAPEPVRFAYTVDSERTEVTLERGESLTLSLTPEQREGLRLEPIEGAAGVASFYTAPLDPAAVEVDPDVTVSRTYDTAALEEGRLVKVTLTMEFGPQALDGCYQVTDTLPSGLRPVVRPWAWGAPTTISYPYRIDGQTVSFCIAKNYTVKGATYYARVVSAGEYTAEPVIAQSMKSAESINFSPPDTVVIR